MWKMIEKSDMTEISNMEDWRDYWCHSQIENWGKVGYEIQVFGFQHTEFQEPIIILNSPFYK